LTKKEENDKAHYSVGFFFVGKRVCLKKKIILKNGHMEFPLEVLYIFRDKVPMILYLDLGEPSKSRTLLRLIRRATATPSIDSYLVPLVDETWYKHD